MRCKKCGIEFPIDSQDPICVNCSAENMRQLAVQDEPPKSCGPTVSPPAVIECTDTNGDACVGGLILKKDTLRNWLRFATFLYVIAGLISIFPALMSLMIFDSPNSGGNPFTLIFFWCVISFPVICAVSILLSWLFFNYELNRAAFIVSLSPLLSFAIAGAAFLCLNWFYHGVF